MLHETIFLATCLATMTTEKHCKLQRGCHTFAIFFRNLERPRWKLFATLSPPAWNLLRSKDGLWLPNFHKIALQVSMDMSHTGYFYFSCYSQSNILLPLQVSKLGCYTWNLSCNLSRNKKLQEKLPRVTWPLVQYFRPVMFCFQPNNNLLIELKFILLLNLTTCLWSLFLYAHETHLYC